MIGSVLMTLHVLTYLIFKALKIDSVKLSTLHRLKLRHKGS